MLSAFVTPALRAARPVHFFAAASVLLAMATAVFVLVVPFDPAGGPLPDGAAVPAPPTPTATPTTPAPDATPDSTAPAGSGGGLAGSGGTPLNAGAWRARWDAAMSGGQVLRGPFDLYLDGRTLTWVREECSAGDTAGRFFVRYYPAAAADLEGGDPYNTASFGFADDGVYHEDMCMMRIEAPAYGLDRIVVGQYDEDGTIWAAGFPLDAGGWLARWDAATSGEPRLSGPFGVYLGGRTLTLVREECSASDTAGRFFLRYYPADDGDLEGEQPYNTVGFAFADGGLHHEGRCMTEIEAPAYGLDRIVAGQYDEDGTIWAAGFPLDAGGWLARWDAATAGEPAADAAFGLYLDGRTLTWAREECTASDTAGRFFLRYYPVAEDDLEGEQPYNTAGFAFADGGLHHGGRCMTAVELPSYPLVRIVTGQYDAGGILWEAELPGPDAATPATP